LPFTPYHFGPSGFLGLVFRKWIDIPVFMLANVAIDIEVLIIAFMGLGRPIHRYAHTLLGGLVLGIVWALAAYPMQGLFKKTMEILRLKYETSLFKMIASGVLGVWLHILVDGIYHGDVRPFWPNTRISFWRMILRQVGYKNHNALKEWVQAGCMVFWIAAILIYLLILWRQWRSKKVVTEK
jgi:membrane-bound metal-dependent hydrolase YbcI (DUF457 family)